MYLPKLSEIKKSRDYQIEFRGLNHNYFVGENEFYNMKNLTSSYYPVLSPRSKRQKFNYSKIPVTALTAAQGKLAWVSGTDFYYNGTRVGEVTEGKKQLVSMGAYICIFPDKKIFNTYTGAFETMEAKWEAITGVVVYSLTTKDGDAIPVSATGEKPSNPSDKDYWIDTSVTPHVLKQYSAEQGIWVSVPTVYTRISAIGIGSQFSKYDGVTISGSLIEGLDGDYVLQDVGENHIVITHLLETTSDIKKDNITVERKVPALDYVCEINNRLWGCNSDKHEIYACKLGDPKNWYSYAGLSTDSYAMTVGSDGDFTGCVSHMGYVIFFKEDIIHKIYGTKPSNFQLTDIHARGVQKGCENSLCVVNETLYYKARNGVCAYDGGLPADVSAKLGIEDYTDAHAGALGNKYYISMKDKNDDFHLFVYDESIGLWHREDNLQAEEFTTVGGELYYVDKDGYINSIYGTSAMSLAPTGGETFWEEEDPVEWEAETGEILYSYPDRRYLSRLQIRTELEQGSTIKVDLKYDNDDEWQNVYEKTEEHRKTRLIPVKPRRCDTVRIRISGTGGCKVFGIGKTLELGSDI